LTWFLQISAAEINKGVGAASGKVGDNGQG
jgi:hypothetical protein